MRYAKVAYPAARPDTEGGFAMLHYAIVFLVIALFAGLAMVPWSEEFWRQEFWREFR